MKSFCVTIFKAYHKLICHNIIFIFFFFLKIDRKKKVINGGIRLWENNELYKVNKYNYRVSHNKNMTN